MEKLNFLQVKEKFKNKKEDILSYFVLVENYEKHLNSKQKYNFLNPDTIDSMIKVLDEKQLSHLKSLLVVNCDYNVKTNFNTYGPPSEREGLSNWFKKNIETYRKELKIDCIYGDICNVCKMLVEKIKKIENNKQNQKKIIAKYKSNLKKFNGNSVEYRQWLALMAYDHGIPDIEKTYDVTKLLRKLNIKYLTDLKCHFNSVMIEKVIMDIEKLEPYLYNLATAEIKDKFYYGILNELGKGENSSDKYDEYNAFKFAIKNDLVPKIEGVTEI